MIEIGTFQFDAQDGQLMLPTWVGKHYVLPGVNASGVQMHPPAAEPFTMRLTRFDDVNYFESNQNAQRAKIGSIEILKMDGIDYSLWPYELNAFVLNVVIVSAEKIHYAAGSRAGTPYEHAPASKIVADWTLVFIPIPTP
jgi:hypothetical protein